MKRFSFFPVELWLMCLLSSLFLVAAFITLLRKLNCMVLNLAQDVNESIMHIKISTMTEI